MRSDAKVHGAVEGRIAREAYANCRVHKNCVDAFCEFRRLSWELRAAREKETASGRGERVSAEEWIRAAAAEEAEWNEAAAEERRKQRAAAAKDTRRMELAARNALTQREIRRANAAKRERLEGDLGKRQGDAAISKIDTEEEKEYRAALDLFHKRLGLVRSVTRRRALLLSRGPTVEVDPATSKVTRVLRGKDLQKALRREAQKKDLLYQQRRQRTFIVPYKGPDVGNMYRTPRLLEDVWLYEDDTVAKPNNADLIHIAVQM
ncbi:hypothetical protein BE221DRAFT_203245 [Ostreococcus tauri]|uniref:Uncharacterized protein n=1 Tax=Ostreococcus tauri TaxID=70448 RepID=A0A1Y5IHA8_OSTTA|nr:hypothetical protein BE221DRAFT_203245 [Ostreococcus tauri]